MNLARNKLNFGELTAQDVVKNGSNGNFQDPKKPAYSINFQLVLDVALGLIITIPLIIFNLLKNFLIRKPKSIKGKICLVTGAGRGLGRELCLKLANLGAHIVCVDIREEINNETVKIINETGGKAYGYTCNVAKYEEVNKLAETVQQEVGRVYLLLNNAALIMSHKAGEWPPEEVISMYNVNVLSHYWTIQAFLPAMKEINEGHIVNILSMSALTGTPGLSVYGSTKAAGENMLCTLRMELNSNKNNKISVTGIYPSIFLSTLDHRNFIEARIGYLDMETVVSSIIDAILYDKTCVSIPNSLYYLMVFTKFLPETLVKGLYDVLNTSIKIPDKQYKQNIAFNDIVNKCIDSKE